MGVIFSLSGWVGSVDRGVGTIPRISWTNALMGKLCMRVENGGENHKRKRGSSEGEGVAMVVLCQYSYRGWRGLSRSAVRLSLAALVNDF